MKKRLWAVALAAAVLLSGCTPLFERSYFSSMEHVEYTVTEDPSILRAETYRGLVDAILYFVNEHAPQGVIRLYNYTSDVDADLDSACQEVTGEDPLGAFAVEDISYEFSRIVSYYEVTLALTYSHTAEEVESIRLVSGTSAIRQSLQEAVLTFAPTLLLRASYFSGDADSIRAMAAQAYFDTPAAAFGMPEIQVSIYPDSGTQRIISIRFDWPEERSTLLTRSAQLTQAVWVLLDTVPSAGAQYTPEELYDILAENTLPMDPAGTSDPYLALSGESANRLAHTLALELLFQQAGISVTLATGSAEGVGTCWLIVDTGNGYRHLLMTADGVQLYTDLELAGLNYLWSDTLYPDCVDYNADLSGSAAPTASESPSDNTPEE